MVRPGRDKASWDALRLALVAWAFPVFAFIPDLVQEVLTMIFLALFGGAVGIESSRLHQAQRPERRAGGLR